MLATARALFAKRIAHTMSAMAATVMTPIPA
jgi:hypothetical protein